MDAVQRIRDTGDPLERVRTATETISAFQEAIVELGMIRRDAVEELRARGLSLTDIAEQAGVTRARLSQLGTAKPRPERALLSSGDRVVIAVPVEPAKYEAGAKRARPVVHQEDTEFIERITALAKAYGLRADTEYVGPGDFIDLNRDGLVITCGPRQSPWLEQALSVDDAYGFAQDEDGWYLEDKAAGTRHRSPEDTDQPSDYAYLGVLARPDGRGGWLYAAGIHAAGSRGAAHYLTEHLPQLHADTKGSAWSCLIRCDYDPTSRAITGAELLAPLKRRGRLKARR